MSHSRGFVVRAVLCVTVSLLASALHAQVLPAPWTGADIGAPDIAGSASESAGTFSVRGAGADIWDLSDQFHFVYQRISGNVDVRACVASVEYTQAWTKAGVMIRETLAADARHASSFVTPAKGLAFQRRIAPGGPSAHTSGEPSTAPYCVRVVRAAELFTSYASLDGASWTMMGSETIPMGSDAYVGIALSSHDTTRASTAVFERVSVATLPSTPASDWAHGDIGNPALAGRASEANGTLSVTGAGADIWNTADQFHFMHQSVTGDVEIVARVVDIEYANVWSKGGVMIREDLTASGAHAFMTGSAARGWAFQRRPVTGGTSVHSPGSYTAPPAWVRLVRSGNTFSGYESADGTNWTPVGTETIDMPAAVYVGLAVTSHNASATSTATFTDVTITQTGGTGEPQPPTVTLTAPASGTTYSAPAAVLLRATASDDGAVEKVEFFANGQSVGTDTEIPYEATFNAGEGTYNLTAVATDDSGASTTSSTATVTVISTPNSPPTASIGSPANGASFVAPANITINATAEDADGAIARVEFYAGTQLIGTATASPFSITWADVAAGSYSLTAVARDDEGASTTSGAISVVVNSPPGPGTGVAFVQQAGRDAGTATSASLAFPAPNTSGNLIAVVVRASSLDQVFTVTDTRGNQYRKAIQFNVTADGVSLAMFYAENVGGGTNTVTVRDTQSGTLRFSILEYSGIAPGTALDVATAAEGSGTLADSGTVTTTSDGVLVLGAFAAANPVSVTAGSGYTLRSTVPANPSAKLAVEDTLQPKAGPVSATASLSAGEVWGSVVAVFRPAGSAPPPAPPGAPTSPSPADGATSIGSGAALSWSASGASTYDVRLGTSSNPPLVASNLTSATYTPAALATNTTYFWQVVARNAAGTATSPIWSFTTSTAPPPPTPTSVAFTASEDHDTLVTSYTVAIYRAGDPVTGTPIASQDLGKPAPSGGDITVDISGIVDPLAAGSYFAVVSAVGAGGSAASAPSANFTK